MTQDAVSVLRKDSDIFKILVMPIDLLTGLQFKKCLVYVVILPMAKMLPTSLSCFKMVSSIWL